jgi:hypothetical protein
MTPPQQTVLRSPDGCLEDNEAMLPSRASDSGQSGVAPEDSVRRVGWLEEGCAVEADCNESLPGNLAAPVTQYACREPMASEIASTNEGGILRQVGDCNFATDLYECNPSATSAESRHSNPPAETGSS